MNRFVLKEKCIYRFFNWYVPHCFLRYMKTADATYSYFNTYIIHFREFFPTCIAVFNNQQDRKLSDSTKYNS